MDWTYAEPWAGNFVSAGFARGVGVDAQIGPGGLSQVYNPYPPSVFVAEIAGIAAQGVRPFLFSGTLKPDGSLERLEFDEIGAAYGEVEKYQKLLRNRDAIKDVAIVFSEQTRLWGLDEIRFREDPWMPLVDAPYTEAVAGAINAGAVAKVACEVVPAWNLCSEELAQYRALILPNMTAMSDEQAAVIAEWVEAGGSLLATMRTGMGDEKGGARLTSALGEVLGVEYLGTDRSYVGTNAYGSYLEDRVGAMWDDLPDTCLAVAPPMVKVRAKGAEVLATHTMPSCRETAEQWVNWWSPPPMTKTEWPAVTLNRYGQGLAMYVGFDLFNMMRAGGQSLRVGVAVRRGGDAEHAAAEAADTGRDGREQEPRCDVLPGAGEGKGAGAPAQRDGQDAERGRAIDRGSEAGGAGRRVQGEAGEGGVSGEEGVEGEKEGREVAGEGGGRDDAHDRDVGGVAAPFGLL